ncbi:MAG: hypothetical protein ACTS27_13120 [Phycisphaerales bacterium]
MNTRDLFELATLDVLGLLDDDERRSFEQAFRAAPPATQAQIRREQLRAAHSMESDLLPVVDTPSGLKGRVMSSVRDAIEAARSGEFGGHVASRVGPFTLALQRNVSPLWRAAAIGLLTASAVLTVALVRQTDQYDTIRETVASDAAVAAVAEQFGAEFAGVFADATTEFAAFIPASDEYASASARIVIDEAGGNAYLVTDSLAERADGYRVVVVGADGQIQRELTRFETSGGLSIKKFAAQGLANATLAILPGSGPMSLDRAVMRTA